MSSKTIEITRRRLLEFEVAAQNFRPVICSKKTCRAGVFENMKFCPNCGTPLAGSEKPQQSNLRFNLDKCLADYKRFDQEFSEKQEDIGNEHWYELDGGVLDQWDNGRFKILKQRNIDKTTALRKLQAETITITPHYAAAVPKDLDYSFIDAFRGIVILPSEADRILAEREALSLTVGDDEMPLRRSDVEALPAAPASNNSAQA